METQTATTTAGETSIENAKAEPAKYLEKLSFDAALLSSSASK